MSAPSSAHRFERVPIAIHPSSQAASARIAAEIATLIKLRNDRNRPTVLGLATGSTPVSLYAELVRLHREEGLSFARVVTFNLDEYSGLPPEHPQSYHHFMWHHLFSHVDIPREQVHIPGGLVPAAEIDAHCAAYEDKIQEAGGIDIQILGIGRTGHIGFNEPGSPRRSRTRQVTLDPLTRRDAAGDFGGEEQVPRHALTMGVRSILNARRVILMAWGQHKADIVRIAVEEEPSAHVTASFLQEHDNCLFVLDTPAAGKLTRVRTPWQLGPLEDQGLVWDAAMQRRAILWLAGHRRKAILKLTDEDYNESGLHDLLQVFGSAYDANLYGFYQLQHTITGWPGGRDPAVARPGDAPVRPLRARSASVFPKRILVLSPQPEDAVVSMGGTLQRLVEQGHEVHVAYQLTGAHAVTDQALAAHLQFAADSGLIDPGQLAAIQEHTARYASTGQLVSDERSIRWKASLRKREAIAAARACGIAEERIHFLDHSFSSATVARRSNRTDADVAQATALLTTLRPHLIFAAGSLGDPHGTPRLALRVFHEALSNQAAEAWFADTELWLYQGANTDSPADDIDLAVPLSPDEMQHRRRAIARHASLRDTYASTSSAASRVALPHWQQAEDRCRRLADLYNALGLAEYEAIEAFKRFTPQEFLALPL